MDRITGYKTERGLLGNREKAYISSLGSVDIVGEGGEFVAFRPENDPDFAYKAIRDMDACWKSRGARPGSKRIDNMVYAGEIGMSPPAERVDKGIVKQKYIDFVDYASIKNSLKRNDEEAVVSTLYGLKKWHDKGKTPGDTNLTNVLDPKKTGGYISVDTTAMKEGGVSGEYASRDLSKLYTGARHADVEDVLLRGIEKVYGKISLN